MNRNRGGAILKSLREINIMQTANHYVAEILNILCDSVTSGMTTWELDLIARRELKKRNLKSPFLGYYDYPATVCVSINEEIVHGIPRKDKIIKEGDIVSVDFGVIYDGYVGDSARTIPVGKIKKEYSQLIKITRKCLDAAIEVCTPDYRLSDIGRIVQTIAEGAGYGVVREFVGHGIGKRMHEDPQVMNYYDGPKQRLREGLVIAIEPMLNMGTHEICMLEDNWTAVTADGLFSAHFEDSIAITKADPIILSRL